MTSALNTADVRAAVHTRIRQSFTRCRYLLTLLTLMGVYIREVQVLATFTETIYSALALSGAHYASQSVARWGPLYVS